MRKSFTQSLTKIIGIFILTCFLSTNITAQNNCVPNIPFQQGLPQNISLGCGANCTSLNISVPHLKQTIDYVVQTIPYEPYAYSTAGGTELVNLYEDDKFSPVLDIPFGFCFYGTNYTQLVVGSNGLVTFDLANQANCNNAFNLDIGEPIPFIHSTAPCGSIFSSYYPKASIMGVYQDIDPSVTTDHATRKIEYRVEGAAPCRKAIVSFNNISMFSCNADTSTSQIVIHEGTGIIDVFVENKTICTSWNDGLGILGIMDETRTKAVSPLGRNDVQWAARNEAYRFLPVGGVSRYVKSELLLNNAIIATGDSSTVNPNELFINFPNVCPATTSSQYVIRTEFANCTDPTNPLTRYDTINITKTAALPGTATPTETTCGGTTGTILVTANGGVAPFTFTLTGPGGPFAPQISATNSTTFTGLGAGSYSINMLDALGCTGDVTATVGNLLSLSSVYTSTGTPCPGINNGTLTVTPDLGAAAGPYTYVLSGPGGPYTQTGVLAAATFTGLTSGTYSVIFTNGGGCSGTIAGMIVLAGTAPTISMTKVNTSCNGAADGTVTVNFTAASGTGPFNVTLNPGGLVQNGVTGSATFTGLAATTYTASFSNAAGCIGSNTITVFNGTSPSASITKTNNSCPGSNDGTVTVTPAGGVGQGPYTVTLNPGGIVQTGVASVAVFTGLAPNTYNATFTNAANCTGTTNSVIVVTGATPTAQISSTNTNCPGVDDGTVTVTPNGGAAQGPYTITLNPGGIVLTGVATVATFTGLPANTYSATFTNAALCSATTVFTIVASGPAVSGTAVSTATSCPTRNDGTITVTPSGSGPYTYTLNPGNIVQPNNPVFTNLAPGPYTITFSTGSGCNGAVSPNPVVNAGPLLTSSTTTFNPPCSYINNGTITIVPGGVAPYSFTLTGPGGPFTQTAPLFSNLAAGTYNYTFTDGNGCTGAGGPVVLTTNTAITTTVTLTMPLCNGNSNGIITLAASGGVPAYEYALSPFAVYQPTGTFNNLAAGTYTFRIKDNAGCIKDTTVTLAEPTVLTASASNTAPASCSGNDGTITVIGLGGTNAYQYSIDGVNYQSSNIFTAPAVGPYPSIKVKDANGCVANAATITVVLVDAMFLNLGNDTTICVESSVKIKPQTNAGTSIYKWRPLDGSPTLVNTIDNVDIKEATMTPLDTATYILHATWGACSREDTIIVNILHKPIPNAGLDTAICDRTYAILRGSASNLSGTVNYAWAPATSVEFPDAAVTNATPDSSQIYTLTVTDNYGCNFSVTDDVLVTMQPPVPAYAGNDTTAVFASPHQLSSSGGATYLWAPAAPLNLSTAQNPLATLTHDQQFVVQVTDIAGCIGYDTVFVQVYQGPNYYVPNAFSPNGDGLNDVFRAVPVGIATTEWFRIFNRYGQLMFETNQWLKGWDGKYKGKTQPMGAYVWVIKGVDKNGRKVEMKGTVMLVQ